MTKKYLLTLIVLLFSVTCIAQEQDPWVGTWTSESYSDIDWKASKETGDDGPMVYASYKFVVRITKNGDKYNVRAKTIRPDDPNYSSYHLPFTIKRMAGNTMWLESYVKKDPFTVDYGKGPFIESYSDNTYYYKLTLNNGTLHYSYYKVHSIDYDKNMNYKGEETMNTSDFRGSNLDLFNDDW